MAPSPTGDPHIGTAYISLFDYALAKQSAGQFVLRIEDTDRTRLVEGAEENIFASLKWLGLNYDEGPDVGGPYSPYRQSERKEIYLKYALDLVKNKSAYYCFCSSERLEKVREEQKSNKQVPRYDRLCRDLSEHEVTQKLSDKTPFVIRLKVPLDGTTIFRDEVRGDISFENKDIDDQVLLKSDGFPTYHLAVVVDDHLMKINYVTRAEEWISSTPKHILLYQAFGWEIPKFVHFPLLRNSDKSKISKRKNHTSLNWYKEQGYLPEAILNFLALQGWSHPEGKEVFGLEEFIAKFSINRISTSGPIFDLNKLDWLNGEYIRAKHDEEVFELLESFYPKEWDKNKVRMVIPLVKERIKKLSEFAGYIDFFFEEVRVDARDCVQKGRTDEATKDILAKVVEFLKDDSLWQSHQTLEESMRKFAEENVWGAKDLFMTMRVKLTGKTATPPLFDTMLALGKEDCIRRLG